MKVLVDYRNVPPAISARGLRYLADRITSGVLALLNPAPRHINIRLYSGWDRGHTLTQEAQRLAVESQRSFPTIRQAAVPVTLNLELAHSIEAAPRKRLENKLRFEPIRHGVRFKKPSETTCRNSGTCPIDNLYDFFSSGRCPVANCAGTVTALADQEQQKLVDTMLVADMIYLAGQANGPVGLVGSDDDMWPGILSVLAAGHHLLHFQTKQWVGQSPYFIPNLGIYDQRAL